MSDIPKQILKQETKRLEHRLEEIKKQVGGNDHVAFNVTVWNELIRISAALKWYEQQEVKNANGHGEN